MFFSQLSTAVSSFFEAHRFIKKHNLWTFVLLPGIINLFIFLFVTVAAWQLSDQFIQYLTDTLMPNWESLNWLKSAVIFVLHIAIRILFFTLYLFVYKQCVLVIMAPIMAYLTEIVMEKQGYPVPPFEVSTFLKNTWRGITIAIINLFKEFVLLLLLGFLVSVPILGLLVPIIGFLVTAYFYGYSLMDYRSEIQGLKRKESNLFVFKHKGIAVGIGGMFYLMLLIPFAGILLAPSYSIVAANISLDLVEKKVQSRK
ncbi:MAG: CysZ protein [Sphingobacteriales bacterium]|jgi:CysZ protein